MTSLRELAIAKLETGQQAGQEVSQSPESAPTPWDTSNPQETAKNGQVSRCPAPIPPRHRDSRRETGTGGETLDGTAPDPRVAHARVREWRARLLTVNPREPRHGISAQRWHQLVDDADWLFENFAVQAAREGWSAADLFGIWPGHDGWGGIADRLQSSRSLVMGPDKAVWRRFGVPMSFNRGSYPELVALWVNPR